MTAPVEDLTVTELLLTWDKRRDRSQQQELGMSSIGGCRRRAGYTLNNIEPTDPGGSMPAVIGTAIDEAVTRAVRGLRSEGLIPTGDLVQHEVRYAGILGHLDWYRSKTACVDDLKTMATPQLGRIKLHGPSKQQRWQVSLYGAGLITQGYPVRQVAITCVARDYGDEHRWTAPFDPALVKDALSWLDVVRETPVDDLPRDYAPDSKPCSWCPFRTACWGEPVPGRDPRVVLLRDTADAKKWALELRQAREDKVGAEAREKTAKGALDAIRPADATPIDVGLDFLLQWKTSVPKRLDGDAVRADYAEAGLKPPMTATPQTRLELVAREPDDQVVPGEPDVE